METRGWADTEIGTARKRSHDGEASYQLQEGEAEAKTLTIPDESHTRSLLKGLTWRFIATMTTVTIAWFVIGEVGTALQIGFVEFFAKIGIYYVHERIWSKIII